MGIVKRLSAADFVACHAKKKLEKLGVSWRLELPEKWE